MKRWVFFSDHEHLVVDIIGRKKLTITKIAEEFYKTLDTESIDQNSYIASVIRRINKKCEFYGLAWTIKGEGSGRNGRTVWKERNEKTPRQTG